MAFSYPTQRMKFMLPIDGTSTLTSGLQAHAQLLEISLLSHTTVASRYVTLSDRMTHQEGTHPADSNSYLRAGSRIGCPLLMCSLEHCWYRQSEKQTMGNRHLKEVQTLWNHLPLKKMYLPSNSSCRLEHNYKSQKMLNFESPFFVYFWKPKV